MFENFPGKHDSFKWECILKQTADWTLRAIQTKPYQMQITEHLSLDLTQN